MYICNAINLKKIQKMGSKKNISKLLGAFILVLALTFSTNSYAKKDGSSDAKPSDNRPKKPNGSSDDKPKKPNGSSDDKPKKPNGSSDDKPGSVPLDGGLSVLLLGAAAFGIKKLRDNKK